MDADYVLTVLVDREGLKDLEPLRDSLEVHSFVRGTRLDGVHSRLALVRHTLRESFGLTDHFEIDKVARRLLEVIDGMGAREENQEV